MFVEIYSIIWLHEKKILEGSYFVIQCDLFKFGRGVLRTVEVIS